ncbi:MAG: alpha/beta hydrolase [Chloroflexi bacterium]|nr:MAG: alpha/beta hydrolase fold protein [Chloroflexi bacterium OLB13]MBV6434939.1 4,5:9,10-diseco-3-hydroxy-5,9,17-trioxoandrosta-1(10),2-diene-4-oate hydrolase [Anaerolineae bacterium]MBW7877972.1 alpha/beta hydrolase [Anaerolineae bacterium]MEB2364651.1 alpha/beta hydrolase [Chloroflexota bacterium]NOG49032.1 alpha/beta hydrolase [Chloroflexota bacterium]
MPFTLTSTGARLHYLDTGGAGEPVLLVHGLLGTASQHFGRLIEWLKPQYRVLGLTLRGYGYSEPKPRTFPPNFYEIDGRDIVAFLEAVNPGPVHLIGYSDGGESSLVAAGLAPQQIRSVTTIGATGYLSPLSRDRVRVYPGDWITPEDVQMHGIADRAAFTKQWEDSFKGMIDAGGDLSLRSAHLVTCPVLMLLGDRDALNPAEAAQVYLDRVPHGRLELIPDCGHGVHVEKWDEFIALLGPHLKHSGGQ